MRLAGLALPAAVWVLGIFSPPREGLSLDYVATFTALLIALVLVDQTAPREPSPPWRRLLWLGAELVLCWLVVRVHGTLIRPALIYLLPASRALLIFGERPGLALSLAVWLAYGLNVALDAWPDRLGEYFPNYLSFFLAPYVVAVVLTLATVRQAADRRRVQALYDELRGAHEQLQALHRQVRAAAVAEERNRLAREIHDSLAHYLTVINVQLEAAEKLGPAQRDRSLDAVRRARRLTLESLREVRRSVAALRAATLEELSLPRAIDKLADEFRASTGIAVELRLAAADDLPLAPEAALALYRAAQEGLTNVQRHARAATVCLSLAAHNGSVELSLQDDGIGPPEANGAGERGFGLLGLRERVELLGGRLSFGRAPSGGSRLAVVVPAGGSR
ncbi:MAG: sensor histidine kinase [Chloroflexi bacterium]|nr:sensor histidine kinase [Chloroflexota bacterium]